MPAPAPRARPHALDRRHAVALRRQPLGEALADRRLVLDQQDLRGDASRRTSAAGGPGGTGGSVRRNTVSSGSPTSDEVARPSRGRGRARAPGPAPRRASCAAAAPRWKRSKSAPRSAGGMPGPSSRTVTSAPAASARAGHADAPGRAVARRAARASRRCRARLARMRASAAGRPARCASPRAHLDRELRRPRARRAPGTAPRRASTARPEVHGRGLEPPRAALARREVEQVVHERRKPRTLRPHDLGVRTPLRRRAAGPRRAGPRAGTRSVSGVRSSCETLARKSSFSRRASRSRRERLGERRGGAPARRAPAAQTTPAIVQRRRSAIAMRPASPTSGWTSRTRECAAAGEHEFVQARAVAGARAAQSPSSPSSSGVASGRRGHRLRAFRPARTRPASRSEQRAAHLERQPRRQRRRPDVGRAVLAVTLRRAGRSLRGAARSSVVSGISSSAALPDHGARATPGDRPVRPLPASDSRAHVRPTASRVCAGHVRLSREAFDEGGLRSTGAARARNQARSTSATALRSSACEPFAGLRPDALRRRRGRRRRTVRASARRRRSSSSRSRSEVGGRACSGCERRGDHGAPPEASATRRSSRSGVHRRTPVPPSACSAPSNAFARWREGQALRHVSGGKAGALFAPRPRPPRRPSRAMRVERRLHLVQLAAHARAHLGAVAHRRR